MASVFAGVVPIFIDKDTSAPTWARIAFMAIGLLLLAAILGDSRD